MASKKYSPYKMRQVHRAWFEINKPDDSGDYICNVCLCPVRTLTEDNNVPEGLSFDHIVRIKDCPALRYDLTNLQVLHATCNGKRDKIMNHPNKRYVYSRADPGLVARVMEQAIGAYEAAGIPEKFNAPHPAQEK